MREPMRKATSDIEIILCPNCSFPNKPKDTYCKYCEIPLIETEPSLGKIIKDLWEKRYEILANQIYLLLGISLISIAVYLLLK
jgi:hypothetical protein